MLVSMREQSIAFKASFILIATFTMLNLFIAVIVNAVQSMHDEEHQGERDIKQATELQLLEEMRKLQREVSELRGELKKPDSSAKT